MRTSGDLIAGPSDDAPLVFRAQAWVHDNRLEAGSETALPPVSTKDATRLLYAFGGRASLAGMTLTRGESIVLDAEDYRVEAEEDTDLVLFTTDTSAAVFTGGMFSGNILRA